MNPVSWAYLLLALAIIAEVTGSTFLVKSEGFTRLWPSLAVVVLFCIAFYLLSQVGGSRHRSYGNRRLCDL